MDFEEEGLLSLVRRGWHDKVLLYWRKSMKMLCPEISS